MGRQVGVILTRPALEEKKKLTFEFQILKMSNNKVCQNEDGDFFLRWASDLLDPNKNPTTVGPPDDESDESLETQYDCFDDATANIKETYDPEEPDKGGVRPPPTPF